MPTGPCCWNQKASQQETRLVRESFCLLVLGGGAAPSFRGRSRSQNTAAKLSRHPKRSSRLSPHCSPPTLCPTNGLCFFHWVFGGLPVLINALSTSTPSTPHSLSPSSGCNGCESKPPSPNHRRLTSLVKGSVHVRGFDPRDEQRVHHASVSFIRLSVTGGGEREGTWHDSQFWFLSWIRCQPCLKIKWCQLLSAFVSFHIVIPCDHLCLSGFVSLFCSALSLLVELFCNIMCSCHFSSALFPRQACLSLKRHVFCFSRHLCFLVWLFFTFSTRIYVFTVT